MYRCHNPHMRDATMQVIFSAKLAEMSKLQRQLLDTVEAAWQQQQEYESTIAQVCVCVCVCVEAAWQQQQEYESTIAQVHSCTTHMQHAPVLVFQPVSAGAGGAVAAATGLCRPKHWCAALPATAPRSSRQRAWRPLRPLLH
jgi:hypothetical protein